jgi:hydroxylamine dehydrogenase
MVSSVPALADVCLDCHKDVTPKVTVRWKKSAHARAGIGCARCHGKNVKASHDHTAYAEPDRCAACHKQIVGQWKQSRHGRPSGEGERAGALCSSCHSVHGTGKALPAKPEVCARCHSRGGQYEAWLRSAHGAAYLSGGLAAGPDCVFCHMPGGTHDVSQGLASKLPGDKKDAARKVMLDVCITCHPPAPAKRALETADDEYSGERAVEDEAHDILNVLWKDGLVDNPPPEDASALATRGVLTRAEALYLQIWAESYRSTQRRYHFGGGARVMGSRQLLAELKGEAQAMRELASLRKQFKPAAERSGGKALSPEELKTRLRELKRRMDTGDITPAQYRSQRDALLDEAGL